MGNRISYSRFQAILDTYGADTTRWPEEDRADAVELLKSSDQAREMFEEARALDLLLMDASECPPPSLDLCDRIMASLPMADSTDQPGASAFQHAPPLANDPFHSLELALPAPSPLRGVRWFSRETLRQTSWTVPVAALAASLLLGIVSGVVVRGATAVTQQPSLEQVMSLGLSDQLASLTADHEQFGELE